MGYTHYWRRTREFDRACFEKATIDFMRVLPKLAELGVPLAGPSGDGEPVLMKEKIVFNGVRMCAHERRDLGITWPAPGVSGVCTLDEGGAADSDIDGSWFAGRLIRSRMCDGDCSHESFWLPRIREVRNWEKAENGLYFDCCKTAYKPYDLAVQVCLIIAAHRLGDAIQVGSDGSMEAWENAIALCQEMLGYGKEFQLT